MKQIEKSPVRRFQAIAVAKGLEFFARTGARINSAWTPSAMMKTAGVILGQVQPRGDYLGTARKLREWAE